MRYCENCSKRIPDDASCCRYCGTMVTQDRTTAMSPTKKGLLISIAAITLSVIILGVMLLAYNPDLTMDDFKDYEKAGMLLKFGVPDETSDNEWEYNDLSLYGVDVNHLSYNFEEKCYTISSFKNWDALVLNIALNCKFHRDGIAYDTYLYENLFISIGSFKIIIRFT